MNGRRQRVWAGACVGVATSSVLLCTLASCEATDPTPPASVDAFRAEGGVLHDEQGREILLRGLNARVLGLFDVTFDDGRTPLETIPPFVEEDCRVMAEDLGMNHLRLPVNWSAIEPVQGTYDEAYLSRILAIADACSKHGISTLVDLHQDAFSKEIGEDGAPLWAIVPPPPELLEGPLEDLGTRRTSAPVMNAFDSFFNDANGVETAYAKMAAWLAAGIDGKPGVVGLELMNEPVLIIFEGRLDDFHDRVAAEVRKVAPELTVFFEPNSLRNLTDRADVRRPVAFDDAVYAPHVYTDVFEDGWASMDAQAIRDSVTLVRAEADDLGATPYVGEFGAAPDANGLAYDRAALDAFDRERISAAFWVYEEWSQGSWGLYDTAANGERGPLRADVADAVARPFPMAVAGKLDAFAYEAATRTLTVQIEAASGGTHVLSVPGRVYPSGVVITCDGTAVDATPSGGRVEVGCAGSTLVMAPAK